MHISDKYPDLLEMKLRKVSEPIHLMSVNRVMERLADLCSFHIEIEHHMRPRPYIFSYDNKYWGRAGKCVTFDSSHTLALTADTQSLMEFFENDKNFDSIYFENVPLTDSLLCVKIANSPKCHDRHFINCGNNYTQKLANEWCI